MLLDEITSPDDLRDLGPQDLSRLCGEIREFLVAAVSRTGGHLGPNLGVVELTVAVHRVFHSPRDALVFDTGHQAYVHKMLTGRLAGFDRLRQRGGLSGYPNRAESEHDIVENSHASTGLSYALALATARQLTGEPGKVVCVVGDGSLTGGMAYEALNNIGHLRPDLIIILNDNGRSYAPTIGGIAENLGQLRLSPTYEAAKDATGRTLRHLPLVGDSAYQAAKRVKESLKQLVSTTSIFETLGLKYGGPIDGHDIPALERALRDAAAYRGPVVIHVVTNKGNGYAPAVQDEIDKYHGVSSFNPEDGSFTSKAVSWTDLFGEALLEAADQDSRIVAITAAMASSTGLLEFAERYPDRFFDVGIAEQHAVTFATGLACEGMRPVVAIYSTFLQRAFDQVMHDTCLMRAPVTFVLDRGGLVGADGPTHHGLYDLVYLPALPGIVVMAPKDENELRHMLYTAININGPAALRFPRGNGMGVAMDAELKALEIGKAEILREGSDIGILALGSMVYPCLEAAARLEALGIHATVINARFVKPLDEELICCLAAEKQFLVTAEEGTDAGGFGSAVATLLQDKKIPASILRIAVPDRIIPHGAPNLLHAKYGLDVDGIFEKIKNFAHEFPVRPELRYRSLLRS
ncbi:MAG TPA: 1-deoxy-D-xylulose-5-phosphate synthase [Chloroflexi bacterium]|nr:1-deoxy-D-xylulose-5-phosphate synthase [Chloroflexota bacterium]